MSTILISLDPAENCGYAVWRFEESGHSKDAYELLASGVRSLPDIGASYVLGTQPKTVLVPLLCAVGLARMLEQLAEEYRSEGSRMAVAYEDVHYHTGIDAAQLYGGHRALILYWARITVATIVPVSVQAGKKALTGRGNADKRDSVLFAEKRFNIVCQSHDEADAIGIGLAAMGSL